MRYIIQRFTNGYRIDCDGTVFAEFVCSDCKLTHCCYKSFYYCLMVLETIGVLECYFNVPIPDKFELHTKEGKLNLRYKKKNNMKFPFFKVRYLPLITEFTELPPTKGRLMLVFMTQFEDDESSYNDARTKLLATFNLN